VIAKRGAKFQAVSHAHAVSHGKEVIGKIGGEIRKEGCRQRVFLPQGSERTRMEVVWVSKVKFLPKPWSTKLL
jgi:hypothetical protein